VLKHRYSSIRTKNRSQFDEGALADAELVRYWEMEDLVDPGVQTVTPTTRTMVNDIQENAFHAYFEDWEKANLINSEADDSTARFRLATKYTGIVMFDAEMDEWRVVVDLEWTSKRAYGNKEGWVLVCELMSDRNVIEIAVAVDKEAIREPPYINDATYVDIIAATSAQTRPMIMKITAGESGDE
jgi:hypothetical protein